MQSIKATGVKETLIELKKLDPELLKQMRRDIKNEPGLTSAVSAIKSKIPPIAPLSGMLHGGRTAYKKARVSINVRPSVRLDRVKEKSIVRIAVTAPSNGVGFEIIDMAGRGSGRVRRSRTKPYTSKGGTREHNVTTQGKRMIEALNTPPSRYVWKAIEGKQSLLSFSIVNIINRYSEKVNIRLRTK